MPIEDMRIDVYYSVVSYTLVFSMRTNIELDDALIAAAMKATGLATKKATVEEALRRLIANDRRRQAIENMYGMGWEGDLDEMREGRSIDTP